ncbi:MAG: PDDEXK nuclease domain-containing protein [Chromatiaceae bacterium]|nr:PDDEXK nuclease domain-containing protein [Chromatiaceae bacterium]
MKIQELDLYRDLLSDIKTRVRQAQHRAALSANAEMIHLYWDIGRMIAARQEREGWGAGVLPRLAVDLKNELPDEKGFSLRNLKLMVQFYRAYPERLAIGQRAVAQLMGPSLSTEIGQPAVAQTGVPSVPESEQISAAAMLQRAVVQLSWAHNVILIQKIKHLPTRLWYAHQALEQGWSRDILTVQIKNRAHERQGAAVTNFSTTLPQLHAALAQGLLKDPYLFDFLTLDEPFRERELETGLLTHIQKFLIELGRGFAFVGRQYRLEVSDREFYLDLLFFHLHLRCFVVVDLKKGDFKPEYAGKMNFYCSVVDDQLRHQEDAPTIGLILCQTKDRILAEYALRDINKPIGVADYELTRALPAELESSLPSIDDIETELSSSMKDEG